MRTNKEKRDMPKFYPYKFTFEASFLTAKGKKKRVTVEAHNEVEASVFARRKIENKVTDDSVPRDFEWSLKLITQKPVVHKSKRTDYYK
jgi:hypothetical protein